MPKHFTIGADEIESQKENGLLAGDDDLVFAALAASTLTDAHDRMLSLGGKPKEGDRLELCVRFVRLLRVSSRRVNSHC